MLRRSNPAKAREWTDRLRRFEAAGETVARFCVNEGVSVPSFYQWKKRLTQTKDDGSTISKPQRKRKRPAESAKFQRVLVSPQTTAASLAIRLPDGSTIEVRDDSPVVQSLIRQLLDRQQPLAVGASSC